MFKWAMSNGASFPNLEYRDGGMFATSHIPQHALLAYVPNQLVLGKPGSSSTTHLELADILQAAASDPNHFFRPTVEAMPWSCQVPACSAHAWPALNLTTTPLFLPWVATPVLHNRTGAAAVPGGLSFMGLRHGARAGVLQSRRQRAHS